MQVVGPHVCGESIDVLDNMLVAGSYRNTKNLILVDLRKPSEILQYLEMDIHAAAAPLHFSESMVYAA